MSNFVYEKERSSNFELLRIFATFLILFNHYICSFTNVDFASHTYTVTAHFLGAFGKVGVNLFILISAYFMIDSNIKIKHFIKIILELMFYYWSILAISLIFFPNLIDYSNYPHIIYHQLILKNWFIENYLILYLLIPLLNLLFNNVQKNTLKMYLIIFGILWFVIPTFTVSIKFAGSYLTEFIYLYFIGGYIKRYGIPFLKSLKNQITLSCISCIAIIIWLIICANFHWYKLIWWFHLSWTASIFTLLISLSIFYFFKNLDIKFNKIINFFAASCLAVYLITGNRCINTIIWTKWLHSTDYYNVYYLFANIIIATISAYIICTLIDKLKNILFMNNINKFIANIQWIKNLDKFFIQNK